jgi:hypothetical protein
VEGVDFKIHCTHVYGSITMKPHIVCQFKNKIFLKTTNHISKCSYIFKGYSFLGQMCQYISVIPTQEIEIGG